MFEVFSLVVRFSRILLHLSGSEFVAGSRQFGEAQRIGQTNPSKLFEGENQTLALYVKWKMIHDFSRKFWFVTINKKISNGLLVIRNYESQRPIS